MTLVNDDVGEIIGWVELGKERLVTVFLINPEGLIGGDVYGGVPSVILAVGVAVNFADGVAEIVGQLAQGLAAQLIAVAEEQGTPELVGVRDAAKKIGGDERLAGVQSPTSRSPGSRLAALSRATFSKTARMAASW